MKKTICLNMIVKNEAHVIVKTLNNLCEKINFSYWVICDTGSTDNTKELITDFFKEKNIPGELVEHEWKDFGHNRTVALESAYNKTDLLFIFDADDEIVGDLVLPHTYEHDGYTFNFGNDVVYIRPLLINNRKRWRFVGVLHEYIACSENSTPHKNIEGNYYVVSGRTGNRSQNPNKYFDDANILKKAHYDVIASDYGLSCRYAFYCAQSYKDSGYMDEAIEWYKKCLDLNMWLQEKYVSAYAIGNLYMGKNDMKNALKYWYKTIEYDPERIEGIINAINYLTKEGEHLIVNALYHRFKKYNKKLTEKLFMVDACYKDQLEYNNAISAFYANDKESGYECCKKIFLNRIVHDSLMKCTISNFMFYIDFFDKENDATKTRLFYLIDDIICDFGKKNETVELNMIACWNKLFETCRSLLCAPSSPSMDHLLKNGKDSRTSKKTSDSIMITFTTCKRLDLFKQTVYSILNHWLDVKSIGTWFCVDDNSSEEDRSRMRSLFPWIQYHMKTGEEKGHRKSMNIIWDKLKETKPKYWIHMEDDFLFHRKMKYIEEGINALKSVGCVGQNVKQILFNRNYGEIIDHYNSRGHVSINDGRGDGGNENIVMHKHCDGVFNYMNCHYWPHYSFRPSIIDASVILELGDYHSENQFFEMDYAKKWTERGYKSAFFNKITCRHIGRLTTDINTKNVANAYDLNNEEQFVNKAIERIDTIEDRENNNAFIKIVNLERRSDRKKDTMNKLDKAGIPTDDCEFIKAVDGSALKPTPELKHLFRNNDFGSRRGVIGCALSHYNLWKRLLNDSQHEYYVIMEDDFVLCSNFKKQLDTLKSNNEFATREVLFLGYHMFEKNRNYDIYNLVSHEVDVKELNKDIYIGGYFAYSINKVGAKKILDYIDQNGINHGIDYLNKILDNDMLSSYECQPQIVFSDWNENGKKIDSDIQNAFDVIDFSGVEDNMKRKVDIDFVFIPGLDVIGCDLYMRNVSLEEKFLTAIGDSECVGFNTLGFFKDDLTKLQPSRYFKEGDGIYIKKHVYDDYLESQKQGSEIIRIKMLCNWTNSKQLCKEWSNMCDTGSRFRWKNYRMVWTDHVEDIDYYVIVNMPPPGAYYDPKKTIVFQMESWVYDENKPWGVKTWGEWAEPDENKFLAVRGRKTNHHNNCFWQLELSLNDLLNHNHGLFDKSIEKQRVLSTICSSKYFDEGHIARIDFLKFLEEKNDVSLDIYNYDNNHEFKNYRGPLSPYKNKSDGLKNYKYYFMVENNYENNFMTEKIWEPILCECLCFYWGCPNIGDYIDSRAFVLLDMNDFEKSYQIIKQAIEEDWWSERIDIIRKEKQKILNQLAFFPTIERTITFDKIFGVFTPFRISNAKNVCFIHSWTNNNHQTKMLDYIIDYIKEAKLYDVLDVIYVMNVGNEIEPSKYGGKVQVINYSKNNELFELQTIKLMHIFSELNPDCNILYLHTKGISYDTISENIMDWINMMLYFNVKLFHKNLILLEKYDVLGCNYIERPHKHFSGNFWWAKSSHIKKLCVYNISNKHDAEWFILSSDNDNFYCLYDSKVNHYQSVHSSSNYLDIV